MTEYEYHQVPFALIMTEKSQVKERCKSQFIAAIKKIQNETRENSGEYVLVLDHNTKGIMSSLFGMTEILNMGVLVLERLQLQRKSFPNANCIYYITPEKQTIDRLFEDFKDKNDPKYQSISLLFSSTLSEELLVRISQNDKVLSRIAALIEYHTDLNFLSENVMNLQLPPSIAMSEESVDRTAQNLFVVCTSFPNHYAFELQYPQQSKYSEMLALKLSELLKATPVEATADSELISVVLADRRIDPVSPLIRNMCYEPLLRDLFQGHGNKITLSSPKVTPPEVRILDSSDNVFCRYRFKHLSQAIQQIKKDLKYEMENSEAAKFSKNQSANLTATIKELPAFNRLKTLYNMHFDLMGKTNDIISKRNLMKLTQLELAITNGHNIDGEDQTNKVLLSSSLEFINSKTTDPIDKNRLIVLSLMCLDLKANDRQNFINELKAIWPNFEKGLSYLCPKRFILKDKKRKKDEEVLLANRQCPVLCEVVSATLAKKEQAGFRTIKVNNIQDKQAQKKHKLGEVKKNQKDKLVIYIAGGIGYNEIAEIQKISQGAHVYYCSSAVLTPAQYIEQIQKFG